MKSAAVEAHIASCSHCRQELETLRPVADSFVFWPTNVLRPSASLQERLARRIAAETGESPVAAARRGNGRNRHGRRLRPESSAS